MLLRDQLKQTDVAFEFDNVEAVSDLILRVSMKWWVRYLNLMGEASMELNRTHVFTLICSPNYTKMTAKKCKG